MTPDSPRSLVGAAHLARNAYLYVRQSTLKQLAENTESTRRQYALKERAVALGWAPEQVCVIDCDQGISGTGAADRAGFQRLVADVSMGRAGIVLGLEVSRLARNCSDWHRLVELCAVTGTLILDQDGLYDPTSFNHQLVLGIKGFMSAAEIGILRSRLREGLLAKAARGELRLQLPVGFVYDEQQRVCLHPDAQVRQAIELVFETFGRSGTGYATLRYFLEGGLRFPRLAGRGLRVTEIIWVTPQAQHILNMLHNPRYAGAFAYGRKRTERGPDGRHRARNKPQEQWFALVHDAHPGYIDWETFERNQRQIARSAGARCKGERHAPPREGSALLQGLVVCGVCGARMSVHYHARPTGPVPAYVCPTGLKDQGRPACQNIHGAALDHAVGQKLVALVSPQTIELTLAVRAELRGRLEQADQLRQKQVLRAQQEVDLARRRYLQVDPDNRLVAATLEADWNDKLRALARARDEAERQREADHATLGQATEARIRALAEDFDGLWHSPATSHRDRKRIATLLIEDVTLVKTDKLLVHLRFKGGAIETLVLPLPQNAWLTRTTSAHVVARVAQLLQDHYDPQVADILNAEGLSTGARQPFDTAAVRWIRMGHGLSDPIDRMRQAGKLTTAEFAAAVGVRTVTVCAGARAGRYIGQRHGPKGIWLFDPIDQQPDPVREQAARHDGQPLPPAPGRKPTPLPLKRRIEELAHLGHTDLDIAQHLNDEKWSHLTGDTYNASRVRHLRLRCGIRTKWAHLRETGMLTHTEIAVCLGISPSSAKNWGATGRLTRVPAGAGDNVSWLYHPIDEQPEPIRQRAASRANINPAPATQVR